MTSLGRGVLAFTGLVRGMSLHVAYPLTEGVSALGVQIIGSIIVFREKIPPKAWAGTGLILMGIVLFSL
jgi:multidrug transporter EmrE-like cation transporter